MADNDTDTNADGNKADGSGNADGQKTDSVVYSPEQQAHMEGLMDAAYAKAYNKADSQYKGQIADLTAKLDALADKKTEAQSDGKKGAKAEDYEAKFAEVNEAHRAELEKVKEQNTAVMNRVLKGDIIDAASQADCVMPSDLASVMMASGLVKLDENGEVEIDTQDTGISKIGDDGKSIGLKTFIERYIATRPMWAKSHVGNGGTGSQDGGEAGKKDLRKMSRADVMALSDEEFAKLKAEQYPQQTSWVKSQ